MTAEPLDLDDWFAPLSLEEFGRTVFGLRPSHVAARPELADRVMRTLGVRGVDDALSLRDPEVVAWFQRLDGRHTTAPIPLGSARRFYGAGTTLYIRRLAEFAGHERELAERFGIPRSFVKFTLFCNRPSAVTRAHFDTVDIVIIQLHGRKTWRMAPNTFAPSPLDSWATLDPIPPDLRLYADAVPPTGMPVQATTYELEPGAVLHLPRGHWHETESDQDSMSLHILLVPPSRMDAVLAELKNELARDERWRQCAYRFGASDETWAHRLRTDHAALREAVARLDERDLLPSPVADQPVAPDTCFVRRGQAACGIDGAPGPDGKATVAVTMYGARVTTTTKITVPAAVIPACQWVNNLRTGSAFAGSDLQHTAPTMSATLAADLLNLLERLQLIRRDKTEPDKGDLR